jgi:hypothetical protein
MSQNNEMREYHNLVLNKVKMFLHF